MTYKTSENRLNLGYSIEWSNIILFNFYFLKQIRLNIFLNTFLLGYLRYFRIKLVKWSGNVSRIGLKLKVISFYWSKLKKKRAYTYLLFKWNKHYFDKKVFFVVNKRSIIPLKILPDYWAVAKKNRNHFWLGSGFLFHKLLKTNFFFTGRNSIFINKRRKKFKKKLFGKDLRRYKAFLDFLNNYRNLQNKNLRFRKYKVTHLYKKDFFFNPFLQFAFKYYFIFYTKFYNYFFKTAFLFKVDKNFFLLFFKFFKKEIIFNLKKKWPSKFL